MQASPPQNNPRPPQYTQAVILALDRKDRERELISTLLVSLCPHIISHEQLEQGFARLLASVEDIALDTPNAPRLLALFLGRAVVDELLAPSFLTTCLGALRPDGGGVDVVRATVGMLGARHAAERLTTCWYLGGATTVEGLREAMQTLLKVCRLVVGLGGCCIGCVLCFPVCVIGKTVAMSNSTIMTGVSHIHIHTHTHAFTYIHTHTYIQSIPTPPGIPSIW